MSKKKPVMSHDPLEGLADEGGRQVGTTAPSPVIAADDAASTQAAEVAAGQDSAEASVSSAEEIGGTRDDGAAVIALDANLTIAETAALQEVLLARLRSTTTCRIDASEVESIDTAGLQLIAAAAKTAAEKGLELTIDKPSERFIDAACQIGLGGLLGVESAVPPA